MKTFIVVGSHRPQSESARVAAVLSKHLQKRTDAPHEVEILDLGKTPLPLWDEELWSEEPSKWDALWKPWSEKLKHCDSLIVISPEYAGTAPAALKNFFLLSTGGQIAHKPALLVAVSSGVGGAYPIAELRMSSYKNSHVLYLPEQLIIRKVNELFVSDDSSFWSEEESYLRKRIDFALNQLAHYSLALSQMRRSSEFSFIEFPYGM